MEKNILISVSPYVQKYHINEKFKDLPVTIKEEMIAKLALLAEKVNCMISLGFYEDGELFIEERHEDPMFYDDIGAGLEIKKLQMEQVEMFKALKMWYILYYTQNGQIVRDILMLQAQKNTPNDILEKIQKKHGAEGKDFAIQLLQE